MARRDDDEPDSLERALAPRPGRRLRAVALGALALAVCAGVVGGIYARSLNPVRGRTVPVAAHRNVPCPTRVAARALGVSIQLQRDNIGLVDDLAWSPRGTCIAVLASQATSSGARGAPLLATYDSASGSLLSVVPLAPVLRRAVAADQLATTALLGLSVIYGDPVWLPDGHHLAVTLTAFTPNMVTPRLTGVLVVDDLGARPRVLLAPISAASTLVEWDLVAGTGQTIAAPPPALDYRWGANGALLPGAMLNTSAPPSTAPLAPIGDPDGRPSFTVWQPGLVYIALEASTPGAAAAPPGAFVWVTQYPALAPDGRFLITGLGMTGRLEPPGRPLPSPRFLAALQLGRTPVLPIHDPALRAILLALNPLGPPVSETPTILSWRPDGKLLAMRPAYISFDETTPHTLDIYDCASGRRIASLGAGLDPGTAFGDAFRPRWSPDGTHLAAYDFNIQSGQGILTIWNLTALEQPA